MIHSGNKVKKAATTVTAFVITTLNSRIY